MRRASAVVLLQCSLVFDLQPQTYPSDKSQIAFLSACYLEGWHKGQLLSLRIRPTYVSIHYPSFTTELSVVQCVVSVFNHPVQSGEAASKHLSLCQGASAVADYSIHFCILAANSGWNDTAVREIYVQGLAEELKGELATREEALDLEMLINLTIHLDNRLRESRGERVRLRHAVPPMAPAR